MNKPQGIIVFGANGSGKSALGRELARILGYKHMDIEDYHFEKSDIPYTVERSHEECLNLMLSDIKKYKAFVLSAATGDFGEEISSMYDLAVFLSAPPDIRIERIRQREYEKHGARIDDGGDMHEQHMKFIDFVAKRDLSFIDKWAETLNCPVITLDSTKSIDTLTEEIEFYISSNKETDQERQRRIYPIVLSEYNPAWPNWFAEEKENLIRLIGKENIEKVNHFGSTSVPGLTSKPTIDILIEIKNTTDIDRLIAAFTENEYIFLNETKLTVKNPRLHLLFLKGYLSDGYAEKVFHIHVRYPDDWDELYFRDYLIANPLIADEYAELKHELSVEYEFDRDGYTSAKSEFVKNVTRKAREEAV